MSSISVPFWAWALFAGVVVASLAIDLVQHRGDHANGRRTALIWSGIWIGVSLLFAAWIGVQFGHRAWHAFVTAWLVEKSLSIDNLFVFLVIFRRLKVPKDEQHRVLFWGIIGAFVTRAVFIAAGSAILSRWHFATWILGAFLVYTGVKTLRSDGDKEAEEESKMLRWLERHLPVTKKRHGHAFFGVEAGKRVATPLLLALIAIELSDIMFAVDSIPAVFAITQEPFIVFTSNVFAILGLRALYLVLADLVADLKYLHYGLGALLLFVGAKMLLSSWIHIHNLWSLAITVAILAAAVVPSLIARRRTRLTEAKT
jgi:tellurite resistance protein TerC